MDRELITEFGEDVTIKTDCENALAQKDDYKSLVELRQSIFDVVKTTPEFLIAKKKRKRWNELQMKIHKPGYLKISLN